jgi:hypothetical protein
MIWAEANRPAFMVSPDIDHKCYHVPLVKAKVAGNADKRQAERRTASGQNLSSDWLLQHTAALARPATAVQTVWKPTQRPSDGSDRR